MSRVTSKWIGMVLRFAAAVALLVALAASSSAQQAVPATIQVRPALKITVAIQPGGARVYTVAAGPTTRMVRVDNPNILGMMEPGDVITQVQGNPIQSIADIRNGVAGGGEIRLRVWDWRLQREFDWLVKVTDGPPKDPADPGPRPASRDEP